MRTPTRRAKRGSISTKVLVSLDASLDTLLREAAHGEGISVSEFVRLAIRDRILRATGKALGLID